MTRRTNAKMMRCSHGERPTPSWEKVTRPTKVSPEAKAWASYIADVRNASRGDDIGVDTNEYTIPPWTKPVSSAPHIIEVTEFRPTTANYKRKSAYRDTPRVKG